MGLRVFHGLTPCYHGIPCFQWVDSAFSMGLLVFHTPGLHTPGLHTPGLRTQGLRLRLIQATHSFRSWTLPWNDFPHFEWCSFLTIGSCYTNFKSLFVCFEVYCFDRDRLVLFCTPRAGNILHTAGPTFFPEFATVWRWARFSLTGNSGI